MKNCRHVAMLRSGALVFFLACPLMAWAAQAQEKPAILVNSETTLVRPDGAVVHFVPRSAHPGPIAAQATGRGAAQSVALAGCDRSSLGFRPQSEQQAVRRLFDRQQFRRLEKDLSGLRARLSHQYCSDRPFGLVYTAILDGALATTSRYDAWIRQEPNSAFAYAARGHHLLRLALYARGAAYANGTAPERMAAMETLLSHAEPDFARSLALDPTFVEAMVGVVVSRSMDSDQETVAAAYRKFAKHAPASYDLDSAMLDALEPHWGGSVPRMRDFAAHSVTMAGRNPDMKLIPSFAECRAAEGAALDEDFAQARLLYAMGTSQMGQIDPQCEFAKGLIARGTNEYPDAALAFARYRATQGSVHNAGKGASTLFGLRRYDEADAVFSEALMFSTASPALRCGRAAAELKLGQWQAAEKDVQIGLATDPNYTYCLHIADLVRQHG